MKSHRAHEYVAVYNLHSYILTLRREVDVRHLQVQIVSRGVVFVDRWCMSW